MKWILASVLVAAVCGLAGCDEKVAQGGACKRHGDCVKGLICAENLTCQTLEGARDVKRAARAP